MNRHHLASLSLLSVAVALLARQTSFLHMDFYLFGLDLRTPMILLGFLLAGFLAGALLKSS